MAENASKQTPREFLIEFIELYRSFTCLWLVKSKEYSDRNKKDLAYIELVKKFKEFDPSADRNTVLKKICVLGFATSSPFSPNNRCTATATLLPPWLKLL